MWTDMFSFIYNPQNKKFGGSQTPVLWHTLPSNSLAHCASVDLAARCNRASASSHPHSLHNNTAKSYATRRMLVDVCRAGFSLIGVPGQTQVVGPPIGAYAGGGGVRVGSNTVQTPPLDPRKFLSFFRAGAASWPASNVYQLLWKRSSSVQKRSPLNPSLHFCHRCFLFFSFFRIYAFSNIDDFVSLLLPVTQRCILLYSWYVTFRYWTANS